MKNSNSITRAELLHPTKKANFISFVEEIENTFTDIDSILICQGLRTFAEQDADYAVGRTVPDRNGTPPPSKIVTRAKGGQSWHCYGLAIDIVPIVNAQIDWNYDYSKFKSIAEKYGLTWGAAWHDNDHYEDNCKQGASGWHWALNKYNSKDFIAGTEYINI